MFRKYIICLYAVLAGGYAYPSVYCNLDGLMTSGLGVSPNTAGIVLITKEVIPAIISSAVTIGIFAFCPANALGLFLGTLIMFATGTGIEAIGEHILGRRIDHFDIISRHIPRSIGTGIAIFLSSVMGGTDIFQILGIGYATYIWCFARYDILPRNRKLFGLLHQGLEQDYPNLARIIGFFNYINIILCSTNSIELISLYQNSSIYSNMICKTGIFGVSFCLFMYFVLYFVLFFNEEENKLLNGILSACSFLLLIPAIYGYIGIGFVIPTVILFQVIAWWESIHSYETI